MINRIIVAVICIPILFIVLFFLPPYVFAGVVALICAISAYELLHSIGTGRNERLNIYAVFAAALIPVGAYFEITEYVFLAVILILMVLTFIEALTVFRRKKPITFAQILVTLFGGAVIPLMLSTLVNMRNMPEGRLIVLLPVISAFITDAGAYFAGVLFGKRKAFPLISPNKTVEGYIGGMLIGTLSVIVYGIVLVFATQHYIHFWALILYGIVGAAFTQLGDLAFSMVKREYDFKDYGRLLPGHGGILDRFDSMVFAAPVMYLLMILIPAIVPWG